MKTGPVVLRFMPDASVLGGPVCVSTFADHGLVVTVCTSLSDVTHHVWARQGKPDARIVIIFEAQDHDARSLVSALRTLHPDLGIVALVKHDDEAPVIELLRTGVDVHCLVNASADLLVAIVLRLLWRLNGVPSISPPADADHVQYSPFSSWELVDQGWILRSPAGHHVTLTTGERAFLTTLLNAPAQKVAHTELIEAVNTAYNTTEGHVHQNRLGVMVSRMRRKFKLAGAPLPLKSVHNWGYMFVADAQARSFAK